MSSEVAVAPALKERELAPLHGSVLRVPARVENTVEIRFAPMHARDKFGQNWETREMKPSFEYPNSEEQWQGYFEINLDDLKLPDGMYEYEIILDRDTDHPVADPHAQEITKFGGYRGVFQIAGGKRWTQPFSWDDEFPEHVKLPNNNEMVLYEMPMRWMESAPGRHRQVGLGTFERTAFSRLDQLHDLGVNAIELLPIQDSADTLNWGYGTRFFFAPDIDMGTPIELKYLVKQCHRRGMRVILDVVMNHARRCPLEHLNREDFFCEPGEEPGHDNPWGGRLFRYRRPAPDGHYPAREFHMRVAEYLIREYHIDGFRIDEFRGIDNWDFIQDFRDRAWQVAHQVFPERPFIVIAEDSARRATITHEGCHRGRKVTDAMWNFGFRDETRRLMRGTLTTHWGEPSRQDRIRSTISGRQTWNDWNRTVQPGFHDLAQAVNYLTSHDVEGEHEKRIMNYLLEPLLQQRECGSTYEDIRWVSDHLADPACSDKQRQAHAEALERLRGAFGLMLTSVGMPMILSGDEFGDVHDIDHRRWQLKMSDPVDWERRDRPENHDNRRLWDAVRELVHLRRAHPALVRNEVDFFYFHPTIDRNDGERVFAYCRTGGDSMGDPHQVVVIANLGPRAYHEFHVPWHWRPSPRLREIGPPAEPGMALRVPIEPGWASLSLSPFQVRVFET